MMRWLSIFSRRSARIILIPRIAPVAPVMPTTILFRCVWGFRDADKLVRVSPVTVVAPHVWVMFPSLWNWPCSASGAVAFGDLVDLNISANCWGFVRPWGWGQVAVIVAICPRKMPRCIDRTSSGALRSLQPCYICIALHFAQGCRYTKPDRPSSCSWSRGRLREASGAYCNAGGASKHGASQGLTEAPSFRDAYTCALQSGRVIGRYYVAPVRGISVTKS